MADKLVKSFRVYGEIDIAKSLATLKGTTEEPKEFLIKGRVLNSVRDESGETPIVPDMEWDYFDKQGFVKAEHDPVTTTIEKSTGKVSVTSTPTFANIIGAPLERIQKSNKEVHITAGLFTDVQAAKDAVTLIKALEEWNRRHPNKPRTIGWSIEGGYIKKAKDGRYAGRVYNVALTANPQDKTTYAEMAHQNNVQMAKSLMAGHGVSPEAQSGGGALRKESLEGKAKDTKTNSSTKSKERKMKKFASKTDAKMHFVADGKSKEEATTLADQHFADQTKSREEAADTMKKSIDAALVICQEATEGLETFVKSMEVQPDDLVRFDVSLKKSVQEINAGAEVDGGDILIQQSKAILAVADQNRQSTTELAKNVAGLYGVLGTIVSLQKSIVEMQEETRAQSEAATERITQIGMGLRKSGSAVRVGDLGSLQPAEGSDVDGAGEDKTKAFEKNVSRYQIANFLADKSMADAEYARYHDAFRKGGFGLLPQQVQQEVRNHFTN